GACIEAGQKGWLGLLPITLFGCGIVFGALFLMAERRQTHPMLPTGLFGTRTFTVAVGVGFGFNLSLYGSLLCLSIYLQQVRHQSALATGLLLLPMAALVALGSIVSGRLTSRVGQRLPMIIGFVIAGAGACILLAVKAHTSMLLVVIGTLALALCSIAMPAMSSLAVNSAPSKRAGVASGVFNTARQAGGALGVAILGSLFAARGSLLHPMTVAAAVLLLSAVVSFFGARAPETSPAGRKR
ncbi:MAG TPA: MFS transporter, partial [Acidimicrobiales bacterium]